VTSPLPAEAMAHGFTGVKGDGSRSIRARVECGRAGGSTVRLPGFGLSDGKPRQHVDPRVQLDDYRNALSPIWSPVAHSAPLAVIFAWATGSVQGTVSYRRSWSCHCRSDHFHP
jgi:hypothetical protein